VYYIGGNEIIFLRDRLTQKMKVVAVGDDIVVRAIYLK
tara:strand:- start:83 stop:196 length:114 start_codon:yes stop_codon:yes gene_type:complete